MRIKLVKSNIGYVVFWKRFRFQPFWYFTDFTCTKCWPTGIFEDSSYKKTQVEAIRAALKYLERPVSGKRRTVATFNSIQELKEYLK